MKTRRIWTEQECTEKLKAFFEAGGTTHGLRQKMAEWIANHQDTKWATDCWMAMVAAYDKLMDTAWAKTIWPWLKEWDQQEDNLFEDDDSENLF